MGDIVALRPPAPKEASDLMWEAHLCLLKADELIRKADEACDAAGIPRDHEWIPLVAQYAKKPPVVSKDNRRRATSYARDFSMVTKEEHERGGPGR